MPHLEPCLRWFGPADPIPLAHVRQAGSTGVVTALHHVACGEVWTPEEIARRKAEIEAAGLRWSVVESVPVHEAVKQGRSDAEGYLDRYCASIRNLGRAGVTTVCYNFMAVTDWTRTEVAMRMPSGAVALRYDAVHVACFDLYVLRRPGAERDYSPEVLARAEARWRDTDEAGHARTARTILLGLPGTVDDLTVEQFRAMLEAYAGVDLFGNLAAFLRRVVPVCEEEGVRLAIHPDDPPFPVFGLPRVAGDEAGLRRLLSAVDSPANGLTFCTGSLGAWDRNDLPALLRALGDRVHFLHLRSVKREPDGSFFEDDHLAGSSDMVAIMREAIALGRPLPMRPDHGHLMGDDLKDDRFYPGYSYVGRLKGLAELRGLEAGLRSVL